MKVFIKEEEPESLFNPTKVELLYKFGEHSELWAAWSIGIGPKVEVSNDLKVLDIDAETVYRLDLKTDKFYAHGQHYRDSELEDELEKMGFMYGVGR